MTRGRGGLPQRMLTAVLVSWLLAAAQAAGPGEAQALYQAGSFEQAYREAAAGDTAAAQTLAAQAAIAQGL